MIEPTRSAHERTAGARHGAWVRLGASAPEGQRALEIEQAAGGVGAAVLEPWETAAAARLKAADPSAIVLCRKRTFLVDDAETGPVRSSGLGYAEVAQAGQWLARDRAEQPITWEAHPGQWQLRVWDPACRSGWTEAVVRELTDSPFDGVLTDDLDLGAYPLDLPLPDLGSDTQLRDAHDALIQEAGEALNAIGKMLVATVEDARRTPERWAALSAWGGVCEPTWLTTAHGRMLDQGAARQQASQLTSDGPGGVPAERLVLARMPIAPSLLRQPRLGPAEAEQLVRCGLAAFWVFGGGRGLFAAGSRDGSQAHWIPEMQWDLGAALGPAEGVVSMWSREFEDGWAVVNLASDGRRRRHVSVPAGLVGPDGAAVRGTLVLGAHQGIVLRRA